MFLGFFEEQLGSGLSNYTLFLSDLPKYYVAGSIITLSGQIFGSTNYDYSSIEFEANNDFGTLPQPVSFFPNKDGYFVVQLPIKDGLTYPEVGQLTISNLTFNTIEKVYELLTEDLQSEEVTFNVPLPIYPNGVYTITGDFYGDETFTIEANGIIDAVSLTRDAFNQYTHTFEVPLSTPDGEYEFILSYSGGTIIETRQIKSISFNPKFTYFDPNAVGIEVGIYPNIKTVDPNTELYFQLIANNSVLTYEKIVANNNGSFSFNGVLLPSNLAGTEAIVRFVSITPTPNIVVEEIITLPSFLSSISAILDDNIVFTGENYVVEVTASSGYTVNLSVGNTQGEVLSIASNEVSANNSVNISFKLPILTPSGSYTFTFTAVNHNSYSFTKPVEYGLFVELIQPNGLIFKGDTHYIKAIAKPNTIINFSVFNTTIQGTTDNEGFLTQAIVIPTTAQFGSNECVVSTNGVPLEKSVNLKVDNEADYSLSVKEPGLILTNTKTPTSVTGVLLPFKTGLLVIPELNINISINPNSYGAFSIKINPDWQPSGAYNLTVTADGETTVKYFNSHRPAIRFTSIKIALIQGSVDNTIEVRGDRNESLIVSVETFLESTTITTDNDGYYNIPLPDIPLNYQTITEHIYKAKTENLLLSDSGTLKINPRIPLTLVVSPLKYEGVLIINSEYSLAGNAPTIGTLAISSIGDTNTLTIDTEDKNKYTGTLITNNTIGELTIIISTLYQPSTQETFQVCHPLELVFPNDNIVYNNTYNIQAITSPNLTVSLFAKYEKKSSSLYTSPIVSTVSNSSGIATFSFTALDIEKATHIEFVGAVSPHYDVKYTFKYTNSISETTGINTNTTGLIGYFDGMLSLTNRCENLLSDSIKFVADLSYNRPITSNVSNNQNEYGIAFASTSFTQSRNLTLNDPLFNSGLTSFDTAKFTSSFYLFSSFSNKYALAFVKLSTGFEARLYLDSVQSLYTFNLQNINNLHDWCWVVNLQDTSNNNNSSFQLYLDGTLLFNHALDYVFNLAQANKENNLRRLAQNSNFSVLNNNILYNKPLSANEIASHYHNGIRKKLRKSIFFDAAKNHRNSFFPISNSEFGFYRTNATYQNGGFVETTATITTDTPSRASGNIAPIFTDNYDRLYWRLNGVDNYIKYNGSFNFHKEHYIVLRRKNLNNVKQVFLDIRGNIKFECAFTDIDTIEIRYYHYIIPSQKVKKNVYKSDAIISTDIMCIYFGLEYSSSSRPNIINFEVNGISITPEFSDFIQTTDKFNQNGFLFVGCDINFKNHAYCDFYGYLPFYPLYSLTTPSLNSLVPLQNESDRSFLPSYIFLTLGFKEAMEQRDPNFIILQQRDGFYYV